MSDEEQARPLRRALVTLSGTALSVRRTVITDDQGRFQFSGLAAGLYGLTAIKEGFVPRSFGSSRPASTGRGSAPPADALSLHAGESRSITVRLPRGAVLAGAVTDSDGQPLEGIAIMALADRFDPATGARRLRPTVLTAGATTDDRGLYRIFGLPAGTYVVYADTTVGLQRPELRRSTSNSRRVAGAPTYYPSTPDAAGASRISLVAGEEREGVDLQVQYGTTGAISGSVSGGDATAQSTGMMMVSLTRVSDALAASIFVNATSVRADGEFTFPPVPPGRYRLRAQSPPSASGSLDGTIKWGATDVVVDGEDVSNVSIQLLPTITVSGKVVFEGAAPSPALAAFRTPLPLFPAIPTSLQGPPLQFFEDGRFTITGLVPGNYLTGPPGIATRGVQTPIGTAHASWWLKSIVLEGRELLDAPLDISHDGHDAVITLADQASTVAGAVKDASGDPSAGSLVVMFSADRAHWFVNSRRVVGVRADAQGRYTIRNLPPGDYRAAVAQDLEQGEWFDPDVLQRLEPAAVKFAIAGVEAKTLDLVVR